MRAAAAVRWAALLLAAAAFCAFGGVSYVQARGDDDVRHARTRDAALAAARAHVARLSSVDASRVAEDLRQWRSSATGALAEELKREEKKSARVLEADGTTLRGTVTDAAVTELDPRTGTATVIATVRVEVVPRTGSPTTDRKRYEAALSRTPDGWKLTSLTPVAVQGAGTEEASEG